MNFTHVKADETWHLHHEAIAQNELEKMLQIVPDVSFWTSDEMTAVRNKYINLYASEHAATANPSKTVFLTFDDGPSKVTENVLDVLKKHNVKATFFVVGTAVREHPEIVKRMVKEGHAIGLHTNTHSYQTLYSSVDEYFKDLDGCLDSIQEVSKSQIDIVRFPGGSNSRYNHINKKIQAELTRRNFVYFDWNIDSKDAKSRHPSAQITANNVISHVKKHEVPIVLMHDERSKSSTPEAVDLIVSTLKKQGYTFDSLSKNINPVQFKKAE